MNNDNTIYLQHPIILRGLKPVHIRKIEHKLIPHKEKKDELIIHNENHDVDSTIIALAVTLTDIGKKVYENFLKEENK